MPITNNILGFKLSRDLNNIIVEKIGSRNISVQIFYKSSYNKFSKVTSILDVENIITFKIPFKDGQYKIRITSTDSITEEFEYKEFLFNSFNQLLDSIINNAKYYLCGCECKDCNDCNDKEGKSNLIIKMFSFYILNKDYYSFFFNLGLDCIQPSVLENINCIITQDALVGDSNYKNISDNIIGYLYYIFYIAERSIFSCCTEQIDIKFNIDDVMPCLDKVNIDTKCIENKIVTDPDFYITDSNFIEI